MTLLTPETHTEYAQRVGPPRVVACDIDLDGHRYVFVCRSHDYRYNERLPSTTYARSMSRCPMSRLEEWRARVWESNAA